VLRSFAQRDLDQMKTSELVAISWALASMQPPNLAEMLKRVESQLLARELSVLSNLELSDMVWAWGQTTAFEMGEQTGLAVMAEVAVRGIHSFRSRELGALLCGLGLLGWNDTTLFEGVADSLATQSLDHFASHDLANLAFAFASLGFYHRALFDRIAAALASKGVQRFAAPDLILAAWSLASGQSFFSSHAKAFFALSLPYVVPSPERTAKHARLLNETIVAWRQALPNESPLPALLVTLSAENWVGPLLVPPSRSEMHVEAVKTLQDMGYVHLEEDFKTSDGLVASIRLTDNVLIELEDSARGFRCLSGTSLRGQCAFKLRLLENSGFYVALLGLKEWRALGSSGDDAKDTQEREAFIQSKLKSLS
jgi:hypothetical protein